ncbi:MAG TPA: RES domain-containing protein [Candidatus Limnocylindria bacterium]|nr:RES domain-containing protein [Candidatus Limnocylindria bacterium]
MLYRLFPWSPSAASHEPGGPLYNPRRQQGSGRHDRPTLYGALYVARTEVSSVAEWLAAFRGQSLSADDFRRTDGRQLALVAFDDARLPALADLDEPAELARRGLRPSGVATHRRPVTQRMAAELYAEGLYGFAWWSTLESSWSNVTLFAERALPLLAIAQPPRGLGFDDQLVREAAAAVGVALEGRVRPAVRRSTA